MVTEVAHRETCAKHPSAAEPTEGDNPWINAFVQGMEFNREVVAKILRGEKTGFDWLGEGDDGLRLFTDKFLTASPGGAKGIADWFHYWSCMEGTNLEPQDETGKAVGDARI